jgi:hypothetical protein
LKLGEEEEEGVQDQTVEAAVAVADIPEVFFQ